ncbi:KpsF/GutQ family sugar-phosphate isomerase [Mycolicibacterium sp. 120266]|uniref:KpsF/GutQ family sugar-phosphate isomerase n=1 Tax=Mycolicibacterium sp. 120266 TaxID=3090601 RepID=UPI00299E8826|nr:KpsF/GutQ family sugar-phosphate isomerase [Mycolicibacterium sp. 120266]MDX1872140.1 KpsF/GutQ family sugar-phosphate isomerase [Mycolicibacterium sp. 120266]
MSDTQATPAGSAVQTARRVFEIEASAVASLADQLNSDFEHAVAHLLKSDGRAIVSGMGKSGIIARKIAATLSSTGTPSFFMHPGEAYHGDLGMVTPKDTFIAISNSGETGEVLRLLPFLVENRNFLVAATGNANSTLATAADCHLDIAVQVEACPLQLAPTSSTTAALAMGDALAIALMEARGFKPENFARFHPGGTLGKRLLNRVEHEMVTKNLPILDEQAGVMAVLNAITSSRLGLTLVRTHSEWAIITDGDLRRAVERFGPLFFERRAADLMTRNPARVAIGTRMQEALTQMESQRISALLVFDGDELVGVVKK